MPCPKCACESQTIQLENWTHGGGCNGRLLIDSDAVVHCEKCGKSAHISKMRISCNSHKHIKIKPSRKEFATAIAIGSIGVVNNIIYWYKRIIEHL